MDFAASSSSPDGQSVDAADARGASMRQEFDERDAQRKRKSYAKHRRVSLYYNSTSPRGKATLQPNETLFRQRTQSAERFDETLLPIIGESAFPSVAALAERIDEDSAIDATALANTRILTNIFSFLTENEILCNAFLVCSTWADAASHAHANLMVASLGYENEDSDDIDEVSVGEGLTIAQQAMELSCPTLTDRFPWGRYLAEGGMKTVFKVWNKAVRAEEAISIM
jgi:hypothetical protein